jgi:6-pyruvoyl-tetrahydropterin synthase
VDFSYLHPKRGLVGESWAVQLVLDGSLDPQGMICDFGVVKRRVKQWLDAHLDHMLAVPAQCRSPEQAIAVLPCTEIDELSVAHWCRDQLRQLFPEQVQGVELAFTTESIDGHYYHYSHGLQQHDGNCQRIAHGHRSRIMIYRNGHRDEVLEGRWAECFRDIYIGTRSHLKNQSAGVHHYAYTAPQGAFELELPARCCYLIDTESTVEQIAAHLAEQIKIDHPQDEVVVRAFEGIGKGAIATA